MDLAAELVVGGENPTTFDGVTIKFATSHVLKDICPHKSSDEALNGATHVWCPAVKSTLMVMKEACPARSLN